MKDSLLDRYHGAGADIFCEFTYPYLTFYLSIGLFTTAFDGEIKAIAVPIEQLSLRGSEFNRVELEAGELSNDKSRANFKESSLMVSEASRKAAVARFRPVVLKMLPADSQGSPILFRVQEKFNLI
ncbi:hypothetical protein TNCV_1651691 [Trichonephila clavipes]|nr:hypothetical protein TNCV_1651691 [Trichonephila clavipes]